MSSASVGFALLIEDALGTSGVSCDIAAEHAINRQRVIVAIIDFELSGICGIPSCALDEYDR
jgi:hypothetical protein